MKKFLRPLMVMAVILLCKFVELAGTREQRHLAFGQDW